MITSETITISIEHRPSINTESKAAIRHMILNMNKTMINNSWSSSSLSQSLIKFTIANTMDIHNTIEMIILKVTRIHEDDCSLLP